MRQTRFLFGGSMLLCILGVGSVVLLDLLGKGGELDGGRLAQGKAAYNVAGLALMCSPLLAVAALCAWWRRDRPLAAVGLLAAGLSAGVTVWGAAADYFAWSRLPPPTDQITYLASFFAMLGSWAVCLAYGVAGLVVRSRRR